MQFNIKPHRGFLRNLQHSEAFQEVFEKGQVSVETEPYPLDEGQADGRLTMLK